MHITTHFYICSQEATETQFATCILYCQSAPGIKTITCIQQKIIKKKSQHTHSVLMYIVYTGIKTNAAISMLHQSLTKPARGSTTC